MTDRIKKPVTPMKEYGRKPYLVTKETVPVGERADYRYMMDTTWHKAQDNEQIVVQSVKKKPYQQQDYQTMEQGYDFPIFTLQQWNFQYDFPFFRIKPEPYRATMEEKYRTGLYIYATPPSWVQCNTLVKPSQSYLIVVRNAAVTHSGRTQYYPAAFRLVGGSTDATGLSLSEFIFNNSATLCTLTTSNSANGSFKIYATSGGKTIERNITVRPSIDCSGNSVSIAQNASINLMVKYGTGALNWSMIHIGTSFGFTLTPDPVDDRKAVLSTSGSARGSVKITVSDEGGNSCIINSSTYGGEGETDSVKCTEGVWRISPPPAGYSIYCDSLNNHVAQSQTYCDNVGYIYEPFITDSQADFDAAVAAKKASMEGEYSTQSGGTNPGMHWYQIQWVSGDTQTIWEVTMNNSCTWSGGKTWEAW
jgi:hypothetical protein